MNLDEQNEQRRIKEVGMTNAQIFKIIDEENLIYKLNETSSSRKGSFNAMKYLEFSFGLGYNQEGKISFNANCLDKEGWSNALNCEPKGMSPVFEFIGLWNTEFEANKKEIESLLKEHKNKLFICKQRSKTEQFKEGALVWEWFPEPSDYNKNTTILYDEDLTEIKKLIGGVRE